MAEPRRPEALRVFSGPCDAKTPADLRRALSLLGAAMVPPVLLADLQAIASELASNAVRAGADWLDAELDALPDALELRVMDDVAGVPKAGNPSHGDTSGRGLLLVEALADEWGFRRHAVRGKTVWARMRWG